MKEIESNQSEVHLDTNLEQVSDYYERMTEQYLKYGGCSLGFHFGLWDDGVKSFGEALPRSNRILTQGCKLLPGQMVLDAGCGVGGLAFYLAETFGVKVVGLTICRPHIEMADRFARERGLEQKVEFRFVDFMKLDLAPESFDFAFNQETFCYALDKEDYLRKVHRVLKPGGRWQTVDFFKSGTPLTEGQEEYHHQIMQGWKTAPLASWQETQEVLAGVGFRDICVKDLSDMARPTAVNFAYHAKVQKDELGKGGRPLSAQEAASLESGAACSAYSQGLAEGAFTYHLVGGAK